MYTQFTITLTAVAVHPTPQQHAMMKKQQFQTAQASHAQAMTLLVGQSQLANKFTPQQVWKTKMPSPKQDFMFFQTALTERSILQPLAMSP